MQNIAAELTARAPTLSSLHNRNDYENKAGEDNDDDGNYHRHAR